MQDIFVPTSKPEDALVEQLHTVTFVTSDKDRAEIAFRDGYGLSSSGWHDPSASERVLLNDYFGFEHDDWQICAFFKEGLGRNIQIRVIYTAEETPRVRNESDGLIVGGATISFPKTDLYKHADHMLGLGFESTMGVKEMDFESPSGEIYTSAEVIYFGPENCYFLAVKRPEIFVRVGPIDPENGNSGAAYSARCIAGTDEVLNFMKTVLGYEIRRDVVFPIGDNSALLLPEGSEERFVQAFAPGADTGYLVFMDHMENNRFTTAPSLGTPNRGITMWSFRSKDIDEVYRRAKAAKADIIHPPKSFDSPFLDGSKSMLMKDPDGFPIEIFSD